MALQVAAADGVKVYTVAGDESAPKWENQKKSRALRRNEEFTRRIELLQDFSFPAAAQRLAASRDGQYLFATGTHAPRVRVWDLAQLSLKFERHFNSEVEDFCILTDDYSKAVFALADRTLSFHARGGEHTTMRVPARPRTTSYGRRDATLYVAGSAACVWRVDLEEGRFKSPLELGEGEGNAAPGARGARLEGVGINALAQAPGHGLLACARDDGVLSCWDPRARAQAGALDVERALAAAGRAPSGPPSSPASGLTAVSFDPRGLLAAVGTAEGRVALFDLRASKPLLVREHGYDSPVVRLQFLRKGGLAAAGAGSSFGVGIGGDGDAALGASDGGDGDGPSRATWGASGYFGAAGGAASSEAAYASNPAFADAGAFDPMGASPVLASADRHGVRAWDTGLGADSPPVFAVESQNDLNDFLVWPGSGLVLTAGDQRQCGAYFAPSLGPAPRWCGFLEALTEELEENATPSTYENYRFVTRDEVARLELSHLVGTPLLKASMHGFFVHSKLYDRARAKAGADDGDAAGDAAARARAARARLEAERGSRIARLRTAPKVNAALAARALAAEEAARARDDDDDEGGDHGDATTAPSRDGRSLPDVAAMESESEEEAADDGSGTARRRLSSRGTKKRRKAAETDALLPAVLRDPRFGALFSDEAFAIDEASEDYLSRHPAAAQAARESGRGGRRRGLSDADLLSEHFAEVPAEAGGAAPSDGGDGGAERRSRAEGAERPQAEEEPRMYRARSSEAAEAFRARRSVAQEREAPLGERARAAVGAEPRRAKVYGAKEISFSPGAGKEGGGVDELGFVPIESLTAALALAPSAAEVSAIAEADRKGRFQLEKREGQLLIRCAQGHSFPLAATAHKEVQEFPALALHATSEAAWGRIRGSGELRRMRRTHVHMAAEPRHLRTDPWASVLLSVDVVAAAAEGAVFVRACNGVLMTEGPVAARHLARLDEAGLPDEWRRELAAARAAHELGAVGDVALAVRAPRTPSASESR